MEIKDMTNMDMSFPAIKGKQGKREFYVAMFPLGVIPRLFKFIDYQEMPAEQRAQRVLLRKRVPEITKYILDNEDSWVFSSLTASFTEDAEFEPSALDPAIGKLTMPLGTEFLINDGQHRRAAIEEALKADRSLAHQTISVVLFPREDLERDQQVFSDLNRTVQKTSRSLDILYDHRDPMNSLTLEVGEKVPVFRGRVEKDQVSLSARSAKFVTLSSLYDANVQLLGKLPEQVDDDEMSQRASLAVDYWTAVMDNIPDWVRVARDELQPRDVRTENITSSAVVLWALGSAGRALLAEYPNPIEWKARLAHLKEIDWRKQNPEWQGICMLGSDIVTRRQTKEATAAYIKWKLGLTSTKPDKVLAAA
jgi:DNA sulfur modification protein DndB